MTGKCVRLPDLPTQCSVGKRRHCDNRVLEVPFAVTVLCDLF